MIDQEKLKTDGRLYRRGSATKTSAIETKTPDDVSELDTDYGTEYTVVKTSAVVRRGKRSKIVSGRFLMKKHLYGENDYHLGDPKVKAQNDFRKLLILTTINKQQAPHNHRFNLPTTIRLVVREHNVKKVKSFFWKAWLKKERKQEFCILVTDVTRGGKDNIIDGKRFQDPDYVRAYIDERARTLFKQQVLEDLRLAEANRIAIDSPLPLDAWSFIKSEQGAEHDRVMMLDVGDFVIIDATDDELKKARAAIEDKLSIL